MLNLHQGPRQSRLRTVTTGVQLIASGVAGASKMLKGVCASTPSMREGQVPI
jgi:hypothetical protein